MMTNKTLRGYSYDLIQRIKAADQTLPTVRLGLMCVEKNISVDEVAEATGTTRQTVYSWFTGKYKPRHVQLKKIEQLLAEYSALPL